MVGTVWRRSASGGVAALVVAIVLAGCVPLPVTPTASESPTENGFLPCMVSSKGGFDDGSTNAQGLAGLTAAARSLGVSEVHVQSNAPSDYAPNINRLLDDGCNLIVATGPELRTAAVAAAKTNPKVKIVILDDDAAAVGDGASALPNVKSIVSDTAQAAFLAGYVAAGYSTTGVVGTYGAEKSPQATALMDGFAGGVAYYNAQKTKSVTVLGWDPATQEGSFVGTDDTGEKAITMAISMIDENADVLLPVGGASDVGAADAILESHKDVVVVGTGSDLFLTDPAHAQLYLTSVTQDVTGSTEAAVNDAAAGRFDNTPSIGTLASGGVGIAPFHDFETRVDPGLPAALDAIKAGIAGGTIAVGPLGIGSSPGQG